MSPETRKDIVRLLKTTDLSTEDIGKRVGLSRTTVTRCGVSAGIDMKQRSFKSGGHKKRKARSTRGVLSHIEDSMSGDGISLQWLTKKWSTS